jgi:hypothetical protein
MPHKEQKPNKLSKKELAINTAFASVIGAAALAGYNALVHDTPPPKHQIERTYNEGGRYGEIGNRDFSPQPSRSDSGK